MSKSEFTVIFWTVNRLKKETGEKKDCNWRHAWADWRCLPNPNSEVHGQPRSDLRRRPVLLSCAIRFCIRRSRWDGHALLRKQFWWAILIGLEKVLLIVSVCIHFNAVREKECQRNRHRIWVSFELFTCLLNKTITKTFISCQDAWRRMVWFIAFKPAAGGHTHFVLSCGKEAS